MTKFNLAQRERFVNHQGKGTHLLLIILHAGSENGWIDGADLVFQSKKATGDYHDEMNSCNSLIVMDNASYHRHIEKVPTSDNRKGDMQDWLTSHGIEYPERALKRELLFLIKLSNAKPKYVIDEMAKAAGHEVVRIPPYHCELNPIELCWSQVKGYIKEHNKEFTLTAVKRLTYEGFNKVGAAERKKHIEPVKRKAEDYYWEADNLQEEMQVGEFTIRVDEDDDDDDTDDEEGSATDGTMSDDSSDDDRVISHGHSI